MSIHSFALKIKSVFPDSKMFLIYAELGFWGMLGLFFIEIIIEKDSTMIVKYFPNLYEFSKDIIATKLYEFSKDLAIVGGILSIAFHLKEK